MLRLRRWLTLAREVRARRFLLDGSFVTAKLEPDDIDAVVLLPADFSNQVDGASEPAIEMEGMLLTRSPEELFAADTERPIPTRVSRANWWVVPDPPLHCGHAAHGQIARAT